MSDHILQTIRSMLAGYVEVPETDFRMEADLDAEYDMDSTELTEFAKRIEEVFFVPVSKSTRQSWVTGNDIAAFVVAHQVQQKIAIGS